MTADLEWRQLAVGIKRATLKTKSEYGWLLATLMFPIVVVFSIWVWAFIQATPTQPADQEKIEAAKARSAEIDDWSDLKSR